MTTPTPRPPRAQPCGQDGAETGRYTQVMSQLIAAGRDITELRELLDAGLAADSASDRGSDGATDRAGAGGPEPGDGDPAADPR